MTRVAGRLFGGLVLTCAAFVALVAATDEPPVEEESLATFVAEPTPTPVAPEPTPTAIPSPEPDPADTADGATTQAVAGEALEVANTDPVEAPTVVVDEYYVPTFVGAVDRSGYDADVSTSLATPTPEPPPPTPHVHTEPTPHEHPTPTPEPAADPAPQDEPAAEPADTGVQENDGDQRSQDPEPTAEPTAEPTEEPEAPSGGPTAAQWEALRQCESGGNYQILSPGGAYRGAYQFSQSTWDWVASGSWPELVGVDPAQAAPADQDKMAFRLYDMQGAAPWPVCGRHLR